MEGKGESVIIANTQNFGKLRKQGMKEDLNWLNDINHDKIQSEITGLEGHSGNQDVSFL